MADDTGSPVSGQVDFSTSSSSQNGNNNNNNNHSGTSAQTDPVPASSPTQLPQKITPESIIHPSVVTENGGGPKKGLPVVMRNIAATECGAKLLQASPAAKHAPSILVNNNDEYMNQPCASDKW